MKRRTGNAVLPRLTDEPETSTSAMAGEDNKQRSLCGGEQGQADLRALFHSHKYNFQDGLDDYCLKDPECKVKRG